MKGVTELQKESKAVQAISQKPAAKDWEPITNRVTA